MAKRNGPLVEKMEHEGEGSFWEQCVSMSLRAGAQSDVAIANADNCLKALRNRLPGSEEEPVSE